MKYLDKIQINRKLADCLDCIGMNVDVSARVSLAQDYFREGYNCSQAVVLAFQDILGADRELLERMSIGFGGGLGRMREVCGTVSAMAFVAGSLEPAEDEDIRQRKAGVYTVVQALAQRFREENGSIICRDLMGLRAGAKQDPVPEARTAEYYKARPCVELVGCSARIIAEYLNQYYSTK